MLKAFGAWKGTYVDFIRRFCRLDALDVIRGNTKDSERVGELRAILRGIMLRRLKVDALPSMPSLSVTPYYVKPDPSLVGVIKPVGGDKELLIARAQERELLEALKGLSQEDALSYLAACVDHFGPWRRINGVLKVQPVVDTIKFDLENGLMDKCVVYAWHRDVIILLTSLLKGLGVNAVSVYGGTPAKTKTRAVDKFKRWHRGVFIGQILAAGTAIDLSCAHQGYMVERDWVPGNNVQALMRMHRIGQERPVTVRDVIISGGVDEILSSVVNRKIEELTALLD